MRIAIASSLSSSHFIVDRLMSECNLAGHETQFIHLFCDDEGSDAIDLAVNAVCSDADLVICLGFPAYYIQHDCKVLWVINHHRLSYDLWDLQEEQGQKHNDAESAFRKRITALDNQVLNHAIQIFTLSNNMSKRLKHYNHVDSSPLYYPPKLAEEITRSNTSNQIGGFIFSPSVYDPLERQLLLLEALILTQQPVNAILCCDDSNEQLLNSFVASNNLQDRVVIQKQFSQDSVLKHYGDCMAVFSGVYDADYGEITLSAMLAKKAVISCYDSGAESEFVIHQQTGFIEPPSAQFIAIRLDELYSNKKTAGTLGQNAYTHYQSLPINWDNVINRLLY